MCQWHASAACIQCYRSKVLHGCTPQGMHVPVELVTAGSPKPGNPPMCKAVAETPGIRYTRIIHNLDVVPGIPFTAWG